jgi:hypothetical protein
MDKQKTTQLIFLVGEDFKKKMKVLAIEKNTNMTELIMKALKQTYKELA